MEAPSGDDKRPQAWDADDEVIEIDDAYCAKIELTKDTGESEVLQGGGFLEYSS